MRLVFVGPLPPWRGGIAHHTAALLDALREIHDVYAVSYASMYPQWLYPGASPLTDADGKQLDDVDYCVGGVNPLSWYRVLKRIEDNQPDAVLIPWWTVFWAPFNAYITRSLKRRGIPTHFICHNVIDHDSSWWAKQFSRLTLAGGAGFISHTTDGAEQLGTLFPRVQVDVYPHPIYEHFSKLPQLPERQSSLELLFFGYVRHYKGVDILIEALGQLKGVDYHLRIAGDCWIDREQLEQS